MFRDPSNQTLANKDQGQPSVPYSDYIYIIDNTFMIACLRAVMNQTLIQ